MKLRKLFPAGLALALCLTLFTTAFAQTPPVSAVPGSAKVLIDGVSHSFDAYLIGNSNYVKLRDLAAALNGTFRQFNTTWQDGYTLITTDSPYLPVGGELTPGDGTVKTATLNALSFYLDYEETQLTAYLINNNNYVNLRELMGKVHVRVDWDAATNTVLLDTKPAPVVVAGLTLGADAAAADALLGAPTEVVTEQYKCGEVESRIYAQNYAKLTIAQILGGKLIGVYAITGAPVADADQSSNIVVFEDKLGTGAPYAVWAVDRRYALTFDALKDLRGQETLLLHTTNALRAIHDLAPLQYSDRAADVARAHSQDMVDRDYFAHETPSGATPGDRLTAGGVVWRNYGENIDAGYSTIFQSTDGWYNSAGHRSNILGDFEQLGNGFVHGGTAEYSSYGTQNFYSRQ